MKLHETNRVEDMKYLKKLSTSDLIAVAKEQNEIMDKMKERTDIFSEKRALYNQATKKDQTRLDLLNEMYQSEQAEVIGPCRLFIDTEEGRRHWYNNYGECVYIEAMQPADRQIMLNITTDPEEAEAVPAETNEAQEPEPAPPAAHPANPICYNETCHYYLAGANKNNCMRSKELKPGLSIKGCKEFVGMPPQQ